MKKVNVRVPGGRVVIRRHREKYEVARCANCKKPLHGMAMYSDVRKLSKTDKRPSRLFGGYFCSGCTKETLREKARGV